MAPGKSQEATTDHTQEEYNEFLDKVAEYHQKRGCVPSFCPFFLFFFFAAVARRV